MIAAGLPHNQMNIDLGIGHFLAVEQAVQGIHALISKLRRILNDGSQLGLGAGSQDAVIVADDGDHIGDVNPLCIQHMDGPSCGEIVGAENRIKIGSF